MKKRFSLILAIVLVCTTLTPLCVSAEATPSLKKVDGEYYYDDFSGYTDGLTGMQDIGYSTTTNVSRFYDESTQNTALKLSGKDDSTNKNYTSVQGPIGNTYAFGLTKDQFENKDNVALVFSWDVHYDYGKGRQVTGYIRFDSDNGSGNYLTRVAKNAIGYSTSTNPHRPYCMYTDYKCELNGSSNHITDGSGNNFIALGTAKYEDVPQEGKWFKMQTVMTYDKATKTYISYNLVDGKPIVNPTTNEIAYQKVSATDEFLTKLQSRNTISIHIEANNTNEGTEILIDNVSLHLVSGASPVADQAKVEGKTITIPFENTFAFTDKANAPEAVKKGYLDVSTADKVKVKKADGTEVQGVSASVSENVLTLNVKGAGTGDTVSVDLTGLKDIAGNQVAALDKTFDITGAAESYNIDNVAFLETFEELSNEKSLSDMGYVVTNGAAFEYAATGKNNSNGLRVPFNSTTRNKWEIRPDYKQNNVKQFKVSAESFEKGTGKALEYGYDVYIPPKGKKNEYVNVILEEYKSDGSLYQEMSRAPDLNVHYGAQCPQLQWFNDASLGYEQTKDGNVIDMKTYAALNQYGIWKKDSVNTDSSPSHWLRRYSNQTEGKWVNVKSRVQYLKDASGNEYYATTSYVDGELLRNADGSPVVYIVQTPDNKAAETGTAFGLKLRMGSGEKWDNDTDLTSPETSKVDNLFMRVVDISGESGELTVQPIYKWNSGKTEFVYANMSDADASYQFIIAGYQGNKLVSVDIENKGTLAKNSVGVINDQHTPVDGVTYKYFLWDGFEKCTPLTGDVIDLGAGWQYNHECKL